MKLITFSIICIIFLMACKKDPFTVDPPRVGDPKIEEGTRVFTFSGDTAFTLVFVDSAERMASIHSLKADLPTGSPTEVKMLSAVSDSVDVEKLRSLFDSESHQIYIVKLGERVGGEICCNTLKQSDLVYRGTGYIEYSYFGWGEKETTSDSTYIPKVMSADEYTFTGIGEVKRIDQNEWMKYEANCCMTLNLKHHEETNQNTCISLQEL